MEEIELDFGAISLDNTVLKSEGYRFNEGLLKEMSQFKESPVQVIQTDIVHNEAIKYISQEISKTRSSIDQALRSAVKQLKINQAAINKAKGLISVDGTENEIADNRLREFYKQIGAVLISSDDYASISPLLKLYFSTSAPFESGKDKKNEFPDAIALLSLEKWAEQNNTNLIAVSQDKGWMNYAEKSTRIKVIPSLSEALEAFLPHNKVSGIIARIREDSMFDKPNHILEQIQNAIEESLDGCDIYVDAGSAYTFDYNDVYATYQNHYFDLDDESSVKINIVRIDDEEIVLKVKAEVGVEITASFDFSVRDSIDKDYVPMGSSTESIEDFYTTDILVTLSGDFTHGIDDIEPTEIEVLNTISHAYFGDVEPDWGEYED